MLATSQKLTDWYHLNKRDLPWRNTQNPYKIWLSEILLQQTRVEQGLPYYVKFVENYPTVKSLANASEDEILALWKGLGYYSRGRNLRKAAIQVQNEFHGIFPSNYKELKGVGEYSAAAIASFAYNEPVAVVDGNVYRVLSRLYNLSIPIDSTEGKKQFKILANEILNNNDAATHNQSIMEFGALWCTPKKPKCNDCPFMDNCEAKSLNKQFELPVKSKKIKKKDRWFVYLVSNSTEYIPIEKRSDNDIWSNMYQFPLMESNSELKNEEDVVKFINANENFNINSIKPFKKHVLSHQNIYSFFVEGAFKKEQTRYEYKTLEELKNMGIPRIIDLYIESVLK